jgi:hypothetical protein
MEEHLFFTHKAEDKETFLQRLSGNPSIVITFHQNPDGDAYGSSLGLKFYLESKGKSNVTLISPTEPAEYLKWMPGASEVKVWDERNSGRGRYHLLLGFLFRLPTKRDERCCASGKCIEDSGRSS